MGGINFDLYELLCRELMSRGFSRVKKLFRSRQMAEVYARQGHLVIIHAPYKVEGKPNKGIDETVLLTAQEIQKEFEDYLQKIKNEIEKLQNTLAPKSISLIFQGGGNLTLPDWFYDWAEKNGIKIRIISEGHPEEIESIFN